MPFADPVASRAYFREYRRCRRALQRTSPEDTLKITNSAMVAFAHLQPMVRPYFALLLMREAVKGDREAVVAMNDPRVSFRVNQELPHALTFVTSLRAPHPLA